MTLNNSTVQRITKHTNADLKHFKDYVQLVADNIGSTHCLVSHLMCVQHLRIVTVLYSPGCCGVMSVLRGVAVGVVTDCDLLSADTTSTTHIILISPEM